MKKLFISCPMKGRSDEAIKKSRDKMHKLAELIYEEELEVIDSFIPGNAPDTRRVPVWYLGKSIQMMADADYFIGIHGTYDFKGCHIEETIAAEYEIPSTFIHYKHVVQDIEVAESYMALGIMR